MEFAILFNVVLFVVVFMESIKTLIDSRLCLGAFKLAAIIGGLMTLLVSVLFIAAQVYWLKFNSPVVDPDIGMWLWLATDYMYSITCLCFTIGMRVWIDAVKGLNSFCELRPSLWIKSKS